MNEIHKKYVKISEMPGSKRPQALPGGGTVPYFARGRETISAPERANKKQRSCFHRARGSAAILGQP